MKTFINLDGGKIGIEFNDDLTEFRYFIYYKKKVESSYETSWCSIDTTFAEMEKLMHDMIFKYYSDHDRGSKKELPMYTRLELKIPVTHLYYHANAGTLPKVLEKEIIYF